MGDVTEFIKQLGRRDGIWNAEQLEWAMEFQSRTPLADLVKLEELMMARVNGELILEREKIADWLGTDVKDRYGIITWYRLDKIIEQIHSNTYTTKE